jgi:predicted GNAT family acetyltransferase
MTAEEDAEMSQDWPQLEYLGWRETCSALHLYLQIAGKYRLARTPWLNHSWNATFYVTPRGLTSSLIPDGPGIEIAFDFVDHALRGTSGDGRTASFALGPSTVAEFHAQFRDLVATLGGTPRFSGVPNEVPFPVPFSEDRRDRPYDGAAVQRFHAAVRAIDGVFKTFRSSFLGKSSPVHLFWGSFDMAVTRFSGRRAPLHPAGIPTLPDNIAHEAYDREVSSAGFWPGGGGIDYPAFYAYAYPEPKGFRTAPAGPEAAFWHEGLSEFILPYDAVRSSSDPKAVLLEFLTATYQAAADLAGWDRDALECAEGRPGAPRAHDAEVPRAHDAAVDVTVERQDAAAKGRYFAVIGGVVAEMTYSRVSTDMIIIDHTDVPAALRGQKIGEQLVRKAVEDARRDGVVIVPLCPFAKAQFGRHADWQDVVAKP